MTPAAANPPPSHQRNRRRHLRPSKARVKLGALAGSLLGALAGSAGILPAMSAQREKVFAALPPSVRKGSAFPLAFSDFKATPPIGRRRSLIWVDDSRKGTAFPHGRRQSRAMSSAAKLFTLIDVSIGSSPRLSMPRSLQPDSAVLPRRRENRALRVVSNSLHDAAARLAEFLRQSGPGSRE